MDEKPKQQFKPGQRVVPDVTFGAKWGMLAGTVGTYTLLSISSDVKNSRGYDIWHVRKPDGTYSLYSEEWFQFEDSSGAGFWTATDDPVDGSGFWGKPSPNGTGTHIAAKVSVALIEELSHRRFRRAE